MDKKLVSSGDPYGLLKARPKKLEQKLETMASLSLQDDKQIPAFKDSTIRQDLGPFKFTSSPLFQNASNDGLKFTAIPMGGKNETSATTPAGDTGGSFQGEEKESTALQTTSTAKSSVAAFRPYSPIKTKFSGFVDSPSFGQQRDREDSTSKRVKEPGAEQTESTVELSALSRNSLDLNRKVPDIANTSALFSFQGKSATLPAPITNSNLFMALPTPVPSPRPSSVNFESMELDKYSQLLRSGLPGSGGEDSTGVAEEMKTTPLFSWSVKERVTSHEKIFDFSKDPYTTDVFPQYALMGHVLQNPAGRSSETATEGKNCTTEETSSIDPIFLNTNAPWSVFVCGSQGSGKSHTLSCILEGCLLTSAKLVSSIGKLPHPLAGMVFHFDNQSSGVCEAAYLCSALPTRVLVSPSNLWKMKKLYGALPGAKKNLTVEPLFLLPAYLNTDRIRRLMAVGNEGEMPLYMHSLIKILREMALSSQGQGSFNYELFRDKLKDEAFSCGQNGPLQLRLDLLESFMKHIPKETPRHETGQPFTRSRSKPAKPTTKIDDSLQDHLVGRPGMLTIIDLSDPVIDSDSACVLFDICLELFIERTKCGKVIALDEAHNYMRAGNASAEAFTATILKSVREQRHKAVRVVVATQEPTVNLSLLDLCSMTFVHRFTSPQWFATLRRHLAGALFADAAGAHSDRRQIADDDDIKDADAGADAHVDADGDAVSGGGSGEMGLFRKIVQLNVGECLLFCPTAALWVGRKGAIEKLWEGYVKFRIRPRVTADGGRSVMAREIVADS